MAQDYFDTSEIAICPNIPEHLQTLNDMYAGYMHSAMVNLYNIVYQGDDLKKETYITELIQQIHDSLTEKYNYSDNEARELSFEFVQCYKFADISLVQVKHT